jgi:hypothetical protein
VRDDFTRGGLPNEIGSPSRVVMRTRPGTRQKRRPQAKLYQLSSPDCLLAPSDCPRWKSAGRYRRHSAHHTMCTSAITGHTGAGLEPAFQVNQTMLNSGAGIESSVESLNVLSVTIFVVLEDAPRHEVCNLNQARSGRINVERHVEEEAILTACSAMRASPLPLCGRGRRPPPADSPGARPVLEAPRTDELVLAAQNSKRGAAERLPSAERSPTSWRRHRCPRSARRKPGP